MKLAILSISLIIIVGCGRHNESARLDRFSERIMFHYQSELDNSISRAQEMIYDKFQVKSKLQILDSLTKGAMSELNKAKSCEESEEIFNQWKLAAAELIDLNMATSNLEELAADPFCISSIKFELAFISREYVKTLALYIEAQEIMFDKIKSFIIPEKTSITLGEAYRATVTLGAYSTRIQEILEIRVDGEPIYIENGIGKIEIKPRTRGKKRFSIEFVGTKNDEFLKPYSLSETIEFLVE